MIEQFEFTIEEEPMPSALPAVPADAPEQREKRNPIRKYLLLALAVFALLAVSLVSFLAIQSMSREITALRETVKKQEKKLAQAGTGQPSYFIRGDSERITIDCSVPLQSISGMTTNEGNRSLTPAAVYAAYVDAVVAIHNEGTYTNVFGQETPMACSGTGFILTEDGYIVTNYHVIENASKLTVIMTGGESCEAKIAGCDKDADLALLKIDRATPKHVSVGNSDGICVGEAVCAIGNPLGELTNSLTAGYVSALDREVTIDANTMNMLQTDCAINEGNSGGPLFDMNGNVIGITSAKYYGTTIEGVGFAIPINDLTAVLSDFMLYGYIRGRGFLGITISDILVDQQNGGYMPQVQTVTAESCAELGGMKPGDFVTAIGETRVGYVSELKSALSEYSAGETITVTVLRDGKELTLTLTLDEKIPEEAALRNVD